MGRVIGVIVAGFGVEQHREAGAVEHQPRHEVSEHLSRELDLIHRLCVRADQLVVLMAEPGLRKFRGDAPAQIFGDVLRVAAGS